MHCVMAVSSKPGSFMVLKVPPGIDLYCATTRRQMGSCCFRCVLTSEDELPLVGLPTILMALLALQCPSSWLSLCTQAREVFLPVDHRRYQHCSRWSLGSLPWQLTYQMRLALMLSFWWAFASVFCVSGFGGYGLPVDQKPYLCV